MIRYLKSATLVAGIALSVLPACAAPAGSADDLARAYALIAPHRFVDLTHSFAPGIPHWHGFPDEKVVTLFNEKHDGFTAQLFTHVGQWGTHVDPPAHFHDRLRTVDQIDPREFFLRLVVLDIHARAAADPDTVVTMDDVKAWEARHGAIPEGAFVALRTDWSKRWPDGARMANKDAKGVSHYPGWSMPVLSYLCNQRHVTAIGHETTDTDPGFAAAKDDFTLESYWLGTNHYQIELMANLDQVPESGALIWVTFPKAQGGSGFPARAVAIVP